MECDDCYFTDCLSRAFDRPNGCDTLPYGKIWKGYDAGIKAGLVNQGILVPRVILLEVSINP